MRDIASGRSLASAFEDAVLSPARRVQLEMDVDRSWLHFTRTATVVKRMDAPGGYLTVLRLDKPVRYWHWVPRLARYAAIEVSSPAYRIVEGKAVPEFEDAYVEVYGVKGTNPEEPHRRWPNIPKRLLLRNLVQFGFAQLRVESGVKHSE